MASLKFLTFNTQFGRRIDRIIDWVNRLPVQDVICFQEFPPEKIKECVKLLGRTPYGYRFAPSFKYHDKLFGELTLYRKDRLKLVSTSVLTLGIYAMERSLFKNTIPRSALIMNFLYRGEKLTVANAHFVAIALNRARYLQITKVAQTLSGKKNRSVLLGDFNISRIGRKKLIRLLETYGYTTPRVHLRTYRLAGIWHQYDYIFGRGCIIEDVSAVRTRLSDHCAVFARCRLGAGHESESRSSSRLQVARHIRVSAAP